MKNMHPVQDTMGRDRGFIDGLPAEYVNQVDVALDRDDTFIVSLFNLIMYPVDLPTMAPPAPLAFSPLVDHTPSARVAMSLRTAEALADLIQMKAKEVRKRYGIDERKA